MVYRKLSIFLFLLCLSIQVSATDLDLFYKQVCEKSDSISTLKADITQVNEFSISKTKIQSVGKLYYKPGNLVLEYSKPSVQKLVIKGSSMLVYDKDSKTVLKTKNNLGISNPLQLVDHYWEKSQKRLISEDSVMIRIRLMPAEGEHVKKIEAAFTISGKMLKELAYWDESGNLVKYRFQNIRTNTTIPSSKWNFVIPSGTKVIQR